MLLRSLLVPCKVAELIELALSENWLRHTLAAHTLPFPPFFFILFVPSFG